MPLIVSLLCLAGETGRGEAAVAEVVDIADRRCAVLFALAALPSYLHARSRNAESRQARDSSRDVRWFLLIRELGSDCTRCGYTFDVAMQTLHGDRSRIPHTNEW
jgi:hypothetical protein